MLFSQDFCPCCCCKFRRRRYSFLTCSIGSGAVLTSTMNFRPWPKSNTYNCTMQSCTWWSWSLHAQATDTVRPEAHAANSERDFNVFSRMHWSNYKWTQILTKYEEMNLNFQLLISKIEFPSPIFPSYTSGSRPMSSLAFGHPMLIALPQRTMEGKRT